MSRFLSRRYSISRRVDAVALLFLSLTSAAFAQTSSLPPGTSGASDEPVATTHTTAPANDPLSQAEAKLAADDYAGARRLLQPYLSAHPADARALFDLGYTEDASGNTAQAEADYRKAIAANPSQFEAHMALGLLLANEKNNAGAVHELSTAAALQPNPPNPQAQAQADRALARLLMMSDPAAAASALVAALKLTPETPPDTLLAADIADKQGDADAAATEYGKVLASAPAGSPERAAAEAGLAHLLIAAKRYPEAESVLRKALTDNPQSPALNSQLADVLHAEGKPKDAIAVLENLHAAHPDDTAVTDMLADLYTQTGDTAKAAPLYQQLLAVHPHDPALLAASGDALVRAGSFAQAIPVLQEATQLDPANGNAWSSLAFAADQTKQPDLVLQALAMRAKVMSETPATYFLAATAHDSLHQTKQAIALYKQFLSVAGTQFPDETWQAKHRLIALEK